ncbi:hypothetical protein GQ44DRAFT_704781 [Phaeosphaeriaceae sp. PMI808]|nr:hypothetical protein GQ44DRAFT_704781 [Phaeosphaeriaceae sp. PMI808]
MSRIACVWADLGDDSAANKWYEDTHIPNVVGQLDTMARNAEQAGDNMFKEVAGIEGTYLTVYDLPNGDDAKDLDEQVHPELEKLSVGARLETRCYMEYANWFGEEWRGDARDVQMWIVVLWQPIDAVHDDFVEWFRDEFVPGMLESSVLLRTRIFKLENASLVKNQKHEQQNAGSMYQYLTLWEFDCDDLPWEILVYLGSSERWRYYVEGGRLKWQISQYLVNRVYPEDENVDSPAAKRASAILDRGLKGAIDDFDEESESDDGDAVDVTSWQTA